MSETNCTDPDLNGKLMDIKDFMRFMKEMPELPKRCDDTTIMTEMPESPKRCDDTTIEGETHLKSCLSGPFRSRAKECMDMINDILDVLNEKIDYPIISVGSGNGVVEGILKTRYTDKTFFCVDPDPQSFQNYPPQNTSVPFLKPDFATTNGLLEAHPDLPGKNILCVFWPPPDHNSDGFDYLSLKSLNPSVFITTYGPCGASGSDGFIKCLDDDGISNKGFSMGKSVYEMVSKLSIVVGSGQGFTGRTMVLAIYVKDEKIFPDFTKTIIKFQRKQRDGECRIQ